MKAATPDEVTRCLAAFDQEFAAGAFPASVPVGWTRLRSGGVSSADITALSETFLSQRLNASRRILGTAAYAEPAAKFILLPVKHLIALAWTQDGPACITVSVGLLEVLRAECRTALLHSYFTRLISNPAAMELLGRKAASVRRMGELLFQYLHACTVLYFFEPGHLPDVDALLSARVREKVTITLEAALIFLLLHELGHVHARRETRPLALPLASVVSEFVLPEVLDARKEEELLADQFALGQVPREFQLHLVHGATFLLNIHNYVERFAGKAPQDHPLSVNRLAALYAQANRQPPKEQTGRLAIEQAVRVARDGWSDASTPTATGTDLDSLKRFVASLRNTNWSATIAAIDLLAAED